MRHHPTLTIFVASALAVFGALAWVTHHALSLERQQRASRAESQIQERVRLALWRMDSKASVLIARESARPYFEYQPFYATDRAYTRMLEEVHAGEVLVPSPLLTLHNRFVKLYFQIDTHGDITSPQAPAGNLRDLAEASYVAPADVIEATAQLEDLATLMAVNGPAQGSKRAGGNIFLNTDPDVPADSSMGLLIPPIPLPAAGESLSRADGRDEPLTQQSEVKAQAGMAPPPGSPQRAPAQTAQPPEQQSLSEYRARVSAAEAVKETAQVDAQNSVRTPSRQASQPVASDTPSSPPAETPRRAYKRPSDTESASKDASIAPQTGSAQPIATAEQPIPSMDPSPPPPPTASTAMGPDSADISGKDQEPARVGRVLDKATNQSPSSIAQSKLDQTDPSPVATPAPQASQPGSPAEAGDVAHPASAAVNRSIERDRYGGAPSISGAARENGLRPDTDPDESGVAVGSFTAGWMLPAGALESIAAQAQARPQLILLRDVHLTDGLVRQGCWIDWPALRSDLLASVRDLLPRADLIPVTAIVTEGGDNLGRRLASFPAELDPGQVQSASIIPLWTPLHNTLLLAWAGVLLAIAAIAALLRAATDLAERRGRFVSAVTHELRTPLTTFVMYSQMLADGMVPEGEPRQHYYTTLKREASRLAGIVENVLEFARLSRKKRTRSATTASGPTRAGELLERLAVPLRQRAQQAGMALDVGIEGGEGAASELISTEELTLDRILFNLVDNACKYGLRGDAQIRTAVTGTITLRLAIRGTFAIFTVSDDGPGISPIDRARIFKAFERGEKQADGSIPGLGLGLALSRGLARDLGGDLTLVSSSPATFELRVPRLS